MSAGTTEEMFMQEMLLPFTDRKATLKLAYTTMSIQQEDILDKTKDQIELICL